MNSYTVLYDDECSLCTFQMKMLTWLDWRNLLSLIPLSDSRASVIAPQLTRVELQEAIHCITQDGKIVRGARALRLIGQRLPLMFPLSILLWIPGVIYLAEIVYKWISKNRYLLSRAFGCKDACAILPKRERTQDSFH